MVTRVEIWGWEKERRDSAMTLKGQQEGSLCNGTVKIPDCVSKQKSPTYNEISYN